MLELIEAVEITPNTDQTYSHHSCIDRLTRCRHMASPIHPDLGPEVRYVSHRRPRDIESCTIGISISILAIMVESRDRRA